MALVSSSSSHPFVPSSYKYDVYISFRAEDIRQTFISHLYDALLRSSIKTYYDVESLERGDEISSSILKAREESKISLVVFSKNYASSTWCLDELVHILECKERGQIVLPIFYHVDPSEVRLQKGSYDVAFNRHEERFKNDRNKVEVWRNALKVITSLSGYDLRDRSEAELIKEIVQHILRILINRTSPSADFKGLVGIEKRIEEIYEQLRIGSADTRVVGIWGMGGIGKTTLAWAVFNQLFFQFEASCFLENVREESQRSGLASLQRRLITQLSNVEVTSAGIPTFLKEGLKRKRILLVLDDVNDPEQLELLAGEPDDWFGVGSRIIVTTRDLQVLRSVGAHEVYEVKELNGAEAMQLFILTAFKSNFPATEYLEESKRIVKYSKGLPLAVRTLGSYLRSSRRENWKSIIDELKEAPFMKVQNVLKISYDGLNAVEKNAFLDIACFLKGEDREFVEQLLGHDESFTPIIIDDLIDKSLITIKHNKQLWMHDLVQQMGWEIVRQEYYAEPGKKSRLWNCKDAYDALTAEGLVAIEAISLETFEINSEVELSPTFFNKMPRLRFLKINSYDDKTKKWNVHFPQGLESLPSSLKYLHWNGYPLKSLPFNFHPDNLVGLVITNSHINDLPWHGVKRLEHLKVLDLSHSEYLTTIPDFYDQAPNLQCIRLEFCTNLVQVPSSFQYFDKLRVLSLRGCSSIKEFPMLPRNMRNVDLSCTSIEKVPSSIHRLKNLETLDMEMCEKLEFLPEGIYSLNTFLKLNFSGCPKLKCLPELPLYLESLNAKSTSLVTWLKSGIALTQGQDDYPFPHSSGRFDFINSLKLDQNAQINIMGEAQLAFLKKATSSSRNKEGGMSEIWYPGDKLPKWFNYQSKGSSIQVMLPPNWCSTNFLGFGLGVLIRFKDFYIDDNFAFYFQFGLAIDSRPHEVADDILTFNWKNDLVGSDHPIMVDSEYVFLFNYHNNSFAATYDSTTMASFQFFSNKSGCNVIRCGVHLLYTEDVEKMISDVTPHVGKLLEIEDVKTGFEDASHTHKPEASGSLNVHDTRTKKEEDTEKRFHDITQEVAESSEIEEQQDDYTSDFEEGTFSYEPESSGSLDVHDEEVGVLNPIENYHRTEPTHSGSCLMFLSAVIDIFKLMFGRQSGSDKNQHREEPQQTPDKVLHSIMTELGEQNKRISQHLQTAMPTTSHGSFDSPATAEKQLHETPEEIIDSLCSQIIEVRNQNSEILRNLQSLLPTTQDNLGMFPELTSSPSASRINDLFKYVIADDEHVEVPEELIHSLRSHLTELQDHNRRMLQFLRVAMSNTPSTSNSSTKTAKT